jgi:hypothetical protein
MEKIKIPFTTQIKGGGKDSFKIMNEKQLINKFKKNGGIFNIIREILSSSNTVNSNNANRINYVKASESNKNRKSKK